MSFIDLQAPESHDKLSKALDCDICIIGTGPAGSTIARELSGSHHRVTILESGGFERQAHNDALNEIESVGQSRVMDQWLVRNRIVGGSSHSWTGRCAPFDEIDFQKREWVPHSGWPFDVDHLAPYFDRTAKYLGLGIGSGFSDERLWTLAGRKVPQPELDHANLLPFFWQFSRDSGNPYDSMRLGRHILPKLGSNVSLVINATALRINPVRSGAAVDSVELAAADGRRWRLSAPLVVLCAGGIENARILLCSDTVVSQGLGNGHDLVGRFLMDHPRGTLASFRVEGSEALQKRFGLYNVKNANGSHLFRHGMRLSPAVQREEGLLNCAAWLGETVTPDDPWNAVKRLLRGKANTSKDLLTVVSNSGLFIRGLNDYFVRRNGLPRKLQRLGLDGMCEQRPDPDSRVSLSGRLDRFGLRLPRIDWRIHEDEPRTMRRMAELAAVQFSRMGFEPPVLEEWVRAAGMFPADFEDIAHPSGTTRMATDPACGVVDPNCQVHGVEGLYIAGSSVFPTSGHCNPTQMIVALALRLADTLKARIGTGAVQTVAKSPDPAKPRAEAARTRVLVTGASGRIGRHVLAELLSRGYMVRALTSKPLTGAEIHKDAVEWHAFDFQKSLDFSPFVEGCAAVLHVGAELGVIDRMQRSNVDATRALAEASERAGVKVFCYTSSVAVYGSGLERLITEDSPVITSDRDVRSEYWAVDALRCYGRTKLQGELALGDTARNVEYVILRPTVVVDVADLIDLKHWSKFKKNIIGHRHTHHVYTKDVADAILWSMERGLWREQPMPGVTVFNLSEDEFTENTYEIFLKKAYAASADSGFRVIKLPWQVDWLRDFLKFRSLPLRHPLGRMVFSSSKMRAVGYTPRFGMALAHSLAFEELRSTSGTRESRGAAWASSSATKQSGA